MVKEQVSGEGGQADPQPSLPDAHAAHGPQTAVPESGGLGLGGCLQGGGWEVLVGPPSC